MAEIEPPGSAQPDRFLKLAQVLELVCLSKSTIYRLEAEGKFPKRCKPGGDATRWVESEILAWKDEVKAARAA